MTDSPFELQRLITVGTFSTPWEAQIAQARLAAEGVESLVADEHVIRMVALSNAIGGIQLKVREPDAAAAAAVLARLAPLPEIYLVGHGMAPAGVADQAGETGEAAAGEAEAAWQTEEREGGRQELRCPSCGSRDLHLERSSRLLLGLLPLSRRGYRCDACGVLWKADEVESGDRPAPPPAPVGPRPAPEPVPGGGSAPVVTAARFHTPWEAHLARTLLESAGVRCCVLEERMPAVHLLSPEPAAYNRLEVHLDDAGRAADILGRAWGNANLALVPETAAEAAPEPEAATEEDPAGRDTPRG
jgi:DNA-directed RNA polymerase subunit RPC12/RpoP